MLFSGFGFVLGFFAFFSAIFFNKVIFDLTESWTMAWTFFFLSNAAFAWGFARFLKKKRTIALTQPELSEKQFFAWEKPSSLFLLPISWWTVVFIGMWIYFLVNGSIPFITGLPPGV